MSDLQNIEPKKVFHWFYELNQIPRCSGDEKRVSDFLVNFAKERNLEVYQDEAYNVIIKKEGTKGYENSDPVIIQGHMDMVCIKGKGSKHDFSRDPIEMIVEGDVLRANNTTLGGDNGIAIAYALAILDSDDLKHPPLEVLITTSEETGMDGARALTNEHLSGKILLNIDTEEGGVKGEDYIPFVPTNEVMPESTAYSIFFGILFAIIFAAANTYLGLKVGLTISAGIPGAILATGLLKSLFKRNSILEANYVASLAAVGESIAGGIIFVLPAIILIGLNLSITTVVLVTIIGGLMGVYFVTPVRRYLIVQEHGELIYPESMAQAEVLVNANQGGSGFRSVLKGLGVGVVYKLLSGAFGLWNETASYTIAAYQGTMIGVDTLASLLELVL